MQKFFSALSKQKLLFHYLLTFLFQSIRNRHNLELVNVKATDMGNKSSL